MDVEELLANIAIIVGSLTGVAELLRRFMRKYHASTFHVKLLPLVGVFAAVLVIVVSVLLVKLYIVQPIDTKEKPVASIKKVPQYFIERTHEIDVLLRELLIKVDAEFIILLSYRMRQGNLEDMHAIPRGLSEQGIAYIEASATKFAESSDPSPDIMSSVRILGNVRDLLTNGVVDRPKHEDRQDYYGDAALSKPWNINGLYALPIFGSDITKIFASIQGEWTTENAYGDEEREIFSQIVVRLYNLYHKAIKRLDEKYVGLE